MNTAYCTTIGADVSDRTTKICVMSNKSGKPRVVRETTIPTTPDGFRAFLEGQDKSAPLVFETGTHSRWIDKVGTGMGFKTFIANPCRLRMITESKTKNDKNDARTLAVPGTLYWMRNISAACAVTPRAAFTPEFSPHSQLGMVGREVPPSASAKRFFRTSEAHQFAYANISNCVSVLSVLIGGDIHEIHPATHCLRTSGWRILSEKIVPVAHPNGGVLEVDEAVADSLSGRMLVWIWYSSGEVSTGSFLHFRRMYSESAGWRTYQVATSAGTGEEGLAAARKLLQRFLSREERP